VGLQRAVRIERVLSVHEEGVRWQDGATVALVSWDRLDAIEVVDEHVALSDGTMRVELPPDLEGISAPDLAAMLIDMRRKSLLGLPIRRAVPDRT
jgi:hypothetical protein